MKKLFLSITMLVVAMGAFAQDHGDYYLQTETTITLAPGETKEVEVEMVNKEVTVYGFQCDIVLPEGLSFVNLQPEYEELGIFTYVEYKRGNGIPATLPQVQLQVGENMLDGGRRVRTLCYPPAIQAGFKPIQGTNGVLFIYKVKADDNAKISTYTIKYEGIVISKDGKKEGDASANLAYPNDTEFTQNAFVFPVLNETEAFPSFEGTLDGVDVTMNRVVKADLNTMVLPFDMTNDEVVAAFGEGSKVYEYTETTAGKIKFNTTTEGIKANVPVLVKATKAIAADENQIFANKTVTYAEAGTVPGMSYTYTGNYAGQIKINAGDYIFSNGSILKTQGASTLKSYRAYIASNGGEVKSLSLEIDDVPTGIELVNGEVETVGDIYTVGGQLVRRNATVKGLPEGIYMINGNKVVVRK